MARRPEHAPHPMCAATYLGPVEDSAEVVKAARARRWTRDGDGWWWRKSRDGDPPEDKFFANGRKLHGFVSPTGVFMRSARLALEYELEARRKPSPLPRKRHRATQGRSKRMMRDDRAGA